MRKLLKIELKHKGELFAICDYLQLEVYAPTTARQFTFKGVNKIRPIILADFEDSIDIIVKYHNYGTKKMLTHFECEFELEGWQEEIGDEWWVSGIIKHKLNYVFSQNKFDIYYKWQNNISIDFYNIKDDLEKSIYLSTCWCYSGFIKRIRNKDFYLFNWAKIKDHNDFYYMASLEFGGKRRYVGDSFETFETCLKDICEKCGYFSNKKIVFYNIAQIDENLKKFYDIMKKKLLIFKFEIEEKEESL